MYPHHERKVSILKHALSKTVNMAEVNIKWFMYRTQQYSPLETEAVTYYSIKTNQSRVLKVLSKLLRFCHRAERGAGAVSIGNTEPHREQQCRFQLQLIQF